MLAHELQLEVCRSDSQRSPALPANLVHYIVVRADLPHGVQVAQTAHAAGESVQRPLPEGTIVVALAVPNEGSLRRVAEALGKQSLTYKLIVENEGPWAGQATALGVVPTADRKAVRKATSALPLVR